MALKKNVCNKECNKLPHSEVANDSEMTHSNLVALQYYHLFSFSITLIIYVEQ